MLEIAIPGADTLRQDHLIADFNGALAFDGELLPGVAQELGRLAEMPAIHVVTADTFGKAREAPGRHLLRPGHTPAGPAR